MQTQIRSPRQAPSTPASQLNGKPISRRPPPAPPKTAHDTDDSAVVLKPNKHSIAPTVLQEKSYYWIPHPSK